jgi:drug/metabolite transporter (DMT)-like permease
VFVNGGIAFWTIVILAFMTQFRIPRQTVIALLLSSCGLLLIGFDSLFATVRAGEWIGDLLFLGAALTWAIFGLLLRRWQIRPQLGILGVASFSALVYLPVYARRTAPARHVATSPGAAHDAGKAAVRWRRTPRSVSPRGQRA